MRSVRSLMLVAVFMAACGGADGSAVTSAPTITMVSTDFETSWSPAWSPPPQALADLKAGLSASRVWMLLPSGPPTAEHEGTLGAEVRITDRTPIGGSGADLVIRRDDQSVYVSVQALPIDGDPICDPLLDDKADTEWVPESIRGVQGCVLLVPDAVSFVAWTEDEQDFLAQFGPESDAATLIAWFGEWRSV